jgi:acetolactate synthase-1/2/3 large subunit
VTPTAPSFVDWLVRRYADAGNGRIFGVPGGGSSLDLIDAARRVEVELVLTAREDAAVIMAGVLGVLQGAPGLAFTTKGPGLASAANGVACAALDRLPVLVIAESFDPGETDYVSHQAFDQAALVAPLLERSGGRVLPATRQAFEGWLGDPAQASRAPAVAFPTGDDMRRPALAADSGGPSPEPTPDSSVLERARALIRASRRPVAIVGLEAARPALAPPVAEFIRGLGGPALCTYMGSGTVSTEDARYAGIFTGGAIEQRCVGEADLIVTIGLDPVELIRKPWTYEAPILDLCERVHVPHYFEPCERLVGALAETLTSLGEPSADGCTWTDEEIAGHRRSFFDGMQVSAQGGASSADVVRAAAAVFEGRPRLAVDAGAHMFSACAFWPARAPRDILISNGLASMGFAVPAAIAAALHEPDRGAVAMTGDGGAMMCLGELKTARQTNANVCVIVFNDGRLSLIDVKREERQMPDLGLSWVPPDFAEIARGFGLAAWKVEDTDTLADALEAARAHRGPSLIDTRIDSDGYRQQLRNLRG